MSSEELISKLVNSTAHFEWQDNLTKKESFGILCSRILKIRAENGVAHHFPFKVAYQTPDKKPLVGILLFLNGPLISKIKFKLNIWKTKKNGKKRYLIENTTGDPEKDKKIRKLNDKLSQIAKLKEQVKSGKQLEVNQLEKIKKESEFLAELKKLQI